jgi:23S rRNA (uracil1939-C5)-methyltransferase
VVDLLALVYGGDAMGRLPDGRAVFAPCGLPGERVRLRLVEQKRGYARGELLEVLRPSPERVLPGCPDAAGCGGCHYAHMTYPAQLAAKTDILRDQLRRVAGFSDPPVEPIVPSPQEWRYRNAIQFHLDPDGRPGFQAPGSHRVVPVEDCRLCLPAISAVLPALDFAGAGAIERVQVRAGMEDEILLVLESSDPLPPELSVDLPISVVFVGPGGLEENAPLVLAGDDHLRCEALGRPFRVSAGSFFQVNTPQAENVLRYLLDSLPLSPEKLLLEVYAGVGLFSAFLAPRVGRLAAVEASPSAIEDFAANLDDTDNVDLYAGPAEEILPALDLRPDLALLDPPRAGLAPPALDALLVLRPPCLAYVSCDPATLARDAKRLAAAGYRLQSVRPFDMFPQTYHIESVSIFNASKIA